MLNRTTTLGPLVEKWAYFNPARIHSYGTIVFSAAWTVTTAAMTSASVDDVTLRERVTLVHQTTMLDTKMETLVFSEESRFSV
ncbi:hypothetical protein TNCV_521171 [Trichonephila clavipes]|nr:hypothetical protein TNCV_521171 [Trichonephila clavipes]